MQFIWSFKISSWKNVAVGIGVGLALVALAGFVFYLAFILPLEIRMAQFQREMEEHERRLIEQGIFIPTPTP
jgi:membrane protein YdbS with pleckstrin-like domain